MIELERWKSNYSGHSKIIMPDVLIVWMGDDGMMASRTLSILLDLEVQRGDIHVLHLLSLGYIGHVV